MRTEIFDLLKNQEGLTFEQILVQILFAALLGVVINLSYTFCHRGTIYSRKFSVSLLILTILTGTVMTVIGNNVALSLGMVGALSIVRFRTALKDTRDTVYVFWAIIVGICCGVGDFLVASIGSAVTFLLMLVMGNVKNDNRMLLIIRGARRVEEEIKASVFQIFSRKAILRVENTTPESFELIYELSSRVLEQSQDKTPDWNEQLYKSGAIDYVNLVMQNDEVSS